MKQKIYLALFILLLNIMIVYNSNSNFFSKIKQNKLNLNKLHGFRCKGESHLDIAVRSNIAGGIECMSLDGKQCASGFKNDISCREFVAENLNSYKPIFCTSQQTSIANHWCSRAQKFLNGFRCSDQTGLGISIKTNRNLYASCLSKDGNTCITGEEGLAACHKMRHCNDKAYIRTFKLIHCNDHDNQGRTNKKWCQKAYAYLYGNGDFLTYGYTGITTPIRLSPEGEIECLSNNGKTCLIGNRNKHDIIKSIVLATENGTKNPLIVKCNVRGFNRKHHWCSKAYNIFYRKQKKGNLKKYNKEINKIKNEVKDKVIASSGGLPPWVGVIKEIIKDKKPSPEVIKNILDRHGFIFDPKRWQKILNNIKNKTDIGVKNAVDNVVNVIKTHTPELKKIIYVIHPQEKNPIKTPPLWWRHLIDKIKTNYHNKVKPNIDDIKKTLENHGFKAPPNEWKKVVVDIQSGAIANPKRFNEVINIIKNNTPALKKLNDNIEISPDHKLCSFKTLLDKLVDILKTHGKSKTGIKKIKDFFKKHFNVQPDVVKEIIKHAKKSNLNTTTGLNKVLRTVKDYVPKNKIKGESCDEIKIGAKCGTKFFLKLNGLLGRKDAKQNTGLNKIKNHFKKHFPIRKHTWRRVRRHISRSRGLHTRKGRRHAINKIKRHIPKRYMHKKHWTAHHKRRHNRHARRGRQHPSLRRAKRSHRRHKARGMIRRFRRRHRRRRFW